MLQRVVHQLVKCLFDVRNRMYGRVEIAVDGNRGVGIRFREILTDPRKDTQNVDRLGRTWLREDFHDLSLLFRSPAVVNDPGKTRYAPATSD